MKTEQEIKEERERLYLEYQQAKIMNDKEIMLKTIPKICLLNWVLDDIK